MTVRLGVIGVGDVAQRDYLPEWRRLDGRAEVVVACGRTAVRVQDVARQFGAARWTTSFEEVVSAPDIDAIINLTPIQLHSTVTLAALSRGKHVYSEKPVAGSAADAETIRLQAEHSGLVVVAAPSVLLFPQLRLAGQLLAEGTLGAIHSAFGLAFAGVPPWAGYMSDPSPYFVAGGGPLYDMAVYPIHALTGLLGPVRRVSALSARTRDHFRVVDGEFADLLVNVEVDDNWHLLLELASGALASVQANSCTAGALAPELELQGERGTLALSLFDVAEPVRLVIDGEVSDRHVQHARASGPDHLLGIEHLVDCITRGEVPLPSVAHAGHVLDVLAAAEQSVRDSRTVDVSSSFPQRALFSPEEVTTSVR
jgi:predicted dehydrogenase